jgi:hypothetical protein
MKIMSQEKKYLDIGVIRKYTVTGDNGEPVTRFSVKLKQNVDLYVDGRRVEFKKNEGRDGKTYFQKGISALPVETKIAQLQVNEKLSAQQKKEMIEGLEKDGAMFTLTVGPKQQAD